LSAFVELFEEEQKRRTFAMVTAFRVAQADEKDFVRGLRLIASGGTKQ